MKNKLLLLLKNNIINTYKLKAMSKKKWLLIIVLIIYIAISIGFSIGMLMSNLFKTLNGVGMSNYYLVILFALASLCALVFSIFSAKNSLFNNKDNDLLFSLPIKRETILASRFIMIALYNFIIGLLFIIPGLIVYFKSGSITWIAILLVLLMIIFFTIIPTILASIFGYLIAVITAKAKYKSMVELLCYTVFIALYLLCVSFFNKIIVFLIGDIKFLNFLLKTLFLPLYLIFKSFNDGSLWYILGFVLLNVACLYLFIKIFNKNYLKTITKLNSHRTNYNYKMATIKSSSIKKALLYKEAKKYFGSAIYVFNTLFGVIIMFIASIASFIYSSDKLLKIANMGDMSSFSLVFFLLLFVISLTNTTSSSISIERENFWIMKMIPVSAKSIFAAKIKLNRFLIIPVSVISLVLFYISGYISIIEALLLIVLTITYACFITNYGLTINLLFPKLDAINDTVIVKQSLASLIGIMGGILFCIIMIGVFSLNIISGINCILVAIIASTILLIVSKIVLNKWGEKRFLQIN